MTPNEVLFDAARHLEVHGWLQGIAGESRKPCCLIGATVAVDPLGEARTEAQAILRDHLGVRSGGLAQWNDAPGRTAAEVIAALRAAAQRRRPSHAFTPSWRAPRPVRCALHAAVTADDKQGDL